ncbi:hypothetical protein [Nitrospirillum amazonense]|uniref:Flagellar basal body rod FlgEFG protein n=1 Tax=Nitrospirillum amazonense TaxID=28077 RepID=A0A560JFE3_9PROT|nr:hypothetical protein [Nitrospirillum amazonense]MDG3440904.1 hypothetical protein [Nitrospirillum amazonense]TWB68044.1 hypothetical protein FBZ87_11287 [Nitrospirillum amazonense]
MTSISAPNPYATVAAGLQSSSARVDRDATAITASKGGDINPTDVVSLSSDALTFKALTKVAQTVDDNSKRLLDIFA